MAASKTILLVVEDGAEGADFSSISSASQLISSLVLNLKMFNNNW